MVRRFLLIMLLAADAAACASQPEPLYEPLAPAERAAALDQLLTCGVPAISDPAEGLQGGGTRLLQR
jgi:hypothetical protein